MTARPSGAVCPRSPDASAMGIIPAIIAVAVIKIARKRLLPPSTAASVTFAPSRRADSANVTSKIAFATEIPMAMIAPMKD